MNRNLPNIDDLFRKALDDYEEEPSEKAWPAISKNLDKRKVVSITRKYKKLKWAAAALLIFSAGLAMFSVQTEVRNSELVQHKKSVEKSSTSSPKNNISSEKVVQIEEEAAKEPGLKNSSTTVTNSGTKSSTASQFVKAVESASQVSKTLKTANRSRITEGAVAITAIEKDNKSKSGEGINAEVFKTIQKSIVSLEKVHFKNRGNLSSAKIKVSTPKNTRASNEPKKQTVADEMLAKVKKVVFDTTIANESQNSSAVIHSESFSSDKSVKLSGKISTKNFSVSNANKSAAIAGISKFSLGVFYSPDFVFLKVNNDKKSYREEDRTEIMDKEAIGQALSLGLLLNYNLYKNWNIQSGLSYSTMTTNVQPKVIYARPDSRGNISYRFNCSAGYSYVTLKSGRNPAAGDSIMSLSASNNLQYISLPLSVSYQVNEGRFRLQPGLGVVANFLTKGTIETLVAYQTATENKSIKHIEGLSSIYISSSISMSANYSLTDKIGVNVTPLARFALSSINKDAQVKTYLNSVALAGGLTIKL